MLNWIGKLTVARKRLQEAWMGLLPLLDIHNIGYLADLQELSRGRQAAGEMPIGPEGQAAFLAWRERRATTPSQIPDPRQSHIIDVASPSRT